MPWILRIFKMSEKNNTINELFRKNPYATVRSNLDVSFAIKDLVWYIILHVIKL